jgi:hypothetical protein
MKLKSSALSSVANRGAAEGAEKIDRGCQAEETLCVLGVSAVNTHSHQTRKGDFFMLALCLTFMGHLFVSGAHAAVPGPALLQAKSEAEAKGYIFLSDREEIMARAKKEGRLRVFSGLDAQKTLKDLGNQFRKKYPFVTSVQAEERGSGGASQRFLMEIKAGLAKEWDATTISTDLYSEYPPYIKKFDILGMAQHRVLDIPAQVIDPLTRSIVAITSETQVVAYNKKLLAPDKVPAKWEDFLKPEFKGRKFCADIRPTVLSALVPTWGLEKVVDFARRIAAQEPVWVRGNSGTMPTIASGENALFMGPNFGAVVVQQTKATNVDLGYRVIEPTPARLGEGNTVLASSEHPYSALLWLEFLVSVEAQRTIDKYEPGEASLFLPGSIQGEAVRGKKVSLVQWDVFQHMEGWQKELVKAYGFPRAEKK